MRQNKDEYKLDPSWDEVPSSFSFSGDKDEYKLDSSWDEVPSSFSGDNDK